MVTLTAGNRRLLVVAAALMAMPTGGSAAEADASDRELQSIAAQRDAAEAAFRSRVAECQRRFFVTSCVDDTKAERRDAIRTTLAMPSPAMTTSASFWSSPSEPWLRKITPQSETQIVTSQAIAAAGSEA